MAILAGHPADAAAFFAVVEHVARVGLAAGIVFGLGPNRASLMVVDLSSFFVILTGQGGGRVREILRYWNTANL